MAEQITQVVMTPEMLQSLIAGIGQNVGQNLGRNTPGPAILGNFSKCTHRFDGAKNQDVDAFLDSIAVYKECLQISDDNALKGFPMLLEGQAATWWQGVKDSTLTFDEATQALKHAFGYSKPAHQIYRELFRKEQKEEEKTDLFVSRCRALLSRLPRTPVLPEAIQLDMVYGLLHLKIRERVPRDNLEDFEDLINEARKAEVTLLEIKRTPDPSQVKSTTVRQSGDSPKPKFKKQCTYCKAYGHIRDECRKLSQKKAETPPITNPSSSSDNTKPQVTCFGCGAIGYIRSNCPTCKTKPLRSETQDGPAEFRYYNTSEEPRVRPLVSIEIENMRGTAILDTGAKTSMAGSQLAQLLRSKNVPYETKLLRMTLADGIERSVITHVFNIAIQIKHKRIFIDLIAVPEHGDSRTLLGVDFIQQANILPDMKLNCWYFGDDLTTPYAFTEEYSPTEEIRTNIDMVSLEIRDDEGSSLTPPEKLELNSTLQGYKDVFLPSTDATPFAEHCIVLTNDVPVAVPPYLTVRVAVPTVPVRATFPLSSRASSQIPVSQPSQSPSKESKLSLKNNRTFTIGLVLRPDCEVPRGCGENSVFASILLYRVPLGDLLIQVNENNAVPRPEYPRFILVAWEEKLCSPLLKCDSVGGENSPKQSRRGICASYPRVKTCGGYFSCTEA
ncbi:hypothetical protein NQ317_016258 [Molorchus minor]|uniref:CCHC-type domain-containing protein n=1 Tax=Molorchus minor TaxID=1323400 RepID=A0ABQ9JZ22_9CUCU|nr:hypothetical protein NQ317_016258 [Molorchus minor]